MKVKMLSFSLTGMDSTSTEDIRRAECVRCYGDKAREARLRWFGPVQRKDSVHIGRSRLPRLKLASSRPGARTQRRFMNVVKKKRT